MPKSNPFQSFPIAKSPLAFRHRLLAWYDANKRPMPWRETRDPYRIWISEVMLQQTRVAAVLDYYKRFLHRFPKLKSLAAAKEADVLAQWSGLGYYRRARMMHATAQQIMVQHSGRFPTTSQQLLKLPGIGRYTAAAIASIAFGEVTAVVDGNVERVILRLGGYAENTQPDFWSIANRLISPTRPADSNQATMELGAIVCLPGVPNCAECPVKKWCRTRGKHVQARAPERKLGQLNYALGVQSKKVYLVQRPKGAQLMAGMWELPTTQANGLAVWKTTHSITSTDYKVTVYQAAPADLVKGRWISIGNLPSLALTGLTRKVLRHMSLLG